MRRVTAKCCRHSNIALLIFGLCGAARLEAQVGAGNLRPGLHGVQGQFTLAQQAGATIQRTFLSWEAIEPSKGNYDWSRLDDVVKKAGAVGMDTFVTIRALSSWGSRSDVAQSNQQARQQQAQKGQGEQSVAVTNKNGSPADMDAWLKTAGLMAERYDGDGNGDMPGLTRPVTYWQIENEVSWQWVDPMDRYIDLLRQTRQAILAANPNAKIVLGAVTGTQYLALDAGLVSDPSIRVMAPNGNRQATAALLRGNQEYQDLKKRVDDLYAGAGPYCDVVDFHTYSDDPRIIPCQAAWIKAEMGKHNYQKPIWNSESGGPEDNYTESAHAEQVVKRLTLAYANGISAVFWSTLVPTTGFRQSYIDMALADKTSGKKPAYLTYQILAPLVAKCTTVTRLQTPASVWAYEYSGATGKFWVGWTDQETQNVTLIVDAATVKTYTVPPAAQPTEARVSGRQISVPLSPKPVIIVPAS